MAARKIKGTKQNPWHEVVRDRIRAAMLEKELILHIHGKRDMSPTQFGAAKTLLGKVLPDLTENDVRVSGDLTVNIIKHGDRKPA